MRRSRIILVKNSQIKITGRRIKALVRQSLNHVVLDEGQGEASGGWSCHHCRGGGGGLDLALKQLGLANFGKRLMG